MLTKVRCFTNLDDFKTKTWPRQLLGDPRVGDRVCAENGAELKIVARTWGFNGILILELHR